MEEVEFWSCLRPIIHIGPWDRQTGDFGPSLNRCLQSREQSSMTGEIRDERYVQKLKNNFSWVWNHSKNPDFFLVFDDVITTGAQFRAYSDFVLENMKNPPRIVGRLWAKAIEEEVLDF